MESADFYLKLLPMIPCQEAERAALAAASARASAESLDRAAFQLLTLRTLEGANLGASRRVKEILAGELKGTIFSKLRLRTAVTLTAWMGSYWQPELRLRDASSMIVRDTICANAESPVYQILLRAIDYRWEEMFKGAADLSRLSGSMAIDFDIVWISSKHVRVCVSGPDASLFAVYILPGVLRAVMQILKVPGELKVEEDGEDVILGMRW
jgi:hypothetical protein